MNIKKTIENVKKPRLVAAIIGGATAVAITVGVLIKNKKTK